jgi:hypothetical protein
MKTNKGEETPSICTLCNADLANPATEKQTHRTVVQHEAGGVKANLVEILLTDRRLIFKEDGMSGAAGAGVLGGAVGGAIAGALSKKSDKFNAILLTDIVSMDEKIVGLLKNKIELTVNTKDNSAYAFTLSKKEMEQWGPGLSEHIT